MPPPRQESFVDRVYRVCKILRCYDTKAVRGIIKLFSPSEREEVSKKLLKRRGKSAVQNYVNSLKRTYSPINLFSYSLFKKCAFTLAEVLITLGIIGVVAALTMPALVAQHRKKALQTALLKTYSELQQVNLKLLADGVSLYEISSVPERAQVIMKQFQGGTAIDGNDSWEGSTTRLYELYKKRGLYGHANNKPSSNPTCDNGGIWTDNIGRLWLFNDSDKQICVDINGIKGPNRYGYDYFVFYSDENNKIIPHYQYRDKEFYIEDGNDCRDYTYYAVTDQHPEEKGKTYWGDYIHF